MEACSDIGSERVVARGESAAPILKRKRIPAPKRADASAEMDQFVRQLTAGFIKQGRDATAFGEASRWGHLPLVDEMLAAGIDVDVRTETGCTALMLAASGGHIDIIRRLIGAGADVNATDPSGGMTPTMWNLAALHSEKTYVSIVRELLKAGADPTITANDGKTTLDWVRERGSERLLALLTEL
jgi:ankyrin repeat protein